MSCDVGDPGWHLDGELHRWDALFSLGGQGDPGHAVGRHFLRARLDMSHRLWDEDERERERGTRSFSCQPSLMGTVIVCVSDSNWPRLASIVTCQSPGCGKTAPETV